ncbi:MAG: PVC-type heme-binding CxxCH protein, partial [Verrucomicrobiota bacterium]
MQRRHAKARLVLLAPPKTDFTGFPSPDRKTRLADLELYTSAMRAIAKEREVLFIELADVDLENAEAEQTLERYSLHMARRLLGEERSAGLDPDRVHETAKAVAQKARYVATVVRPVNTVLYFGVRGRRHEYEAEIPRYHDLIAQSDRLIHALAADGKRRFADVPPPVLEPLKIPTRPGEIPSPDAVEKTMTVAEGYAVNCFASEVDFPDLANPEQIAFDSRGRLWVVTMPSFPHTIPGEAPRDKIVILEDTDRDGKADTSTVFADGLNVPDGLAFYKDGVIVSHQPRLVYMEDTDGDDRADYEQELLRGIDVTDSHHGGMIAMGPMGHVMFCDGVFHRSQLETPFGVVRGIDATTYRFNLRNGRIEREYQTLTPNPWKITWDRWGNLFQMYGDGFVQDSYAMPWTPFGIYHPFRRAISVAYGKGSAAAVISSPNFPDTYQQGMASAVCVRGHVVSISKHAPKDAYFKASDRLDLVSTRDKHFRPVDIAFGFDGAMYVSDFCSRIIGHAQNPLRDPRWDGPYGRIWRVVHTGKPLVKEWPHIEGAGIDGWLELLQHPQDVVRDHARRKLRHTEGVETTLEAWLARQKGDEASTLEALWILAARGGGRGDWLEVLLASDDARMRAAGTHLIRFLAQDLKDPLGLLKRMAADSNNRVKVAVMHTVSHLQQNHPEWA